jgi:hypothetical protein
MADLMGLWLPIVAAAIAVFVASSLVHMVFKWHKSDFGRLSDEDEVQSVLRKAGAARGQFIVPYCQDMKESQSEAMKAKYIAGPIALQVYGRGEHGHEAGHLAGLLTALAYGGGSIGQGVWMGKPWRVVALDLLDALIYGTVTALVFWKLWS